MTLEEAQKEVDKWIKTYGVRYFSELTNMAVLTEEVGELARIMARTYGDQSFKKSDEDEEAGKHINQEFEIIRNTYLKLAKKTTLSTSDQHAITDVVKQNLPIDQVIIWIQECYDHFLPKHPRDQIRSFQYIANYIFDQAFSNYQQEVTQNGENWELFSEPAITHSTANCGGAEDEYFKRYRARVEESENDTECDF